MLLSVTVSVVPCCALQQLHSCRWCCLLLVYCAGWFFPVCLCRWFGVSLVSSWCWCYSCLIWLFTWGGLAWWFVWALEVCSVCFDGVGAPCSVSLCWLLSSQGIWGLHFIMFRNVLILMPFAHGQDTSLWCKTIQEKCITLATTITNFVPRLCKSVTFAIADQSCQMLRTSSVYQGSTSQYQSRLYWARSEGRAWASY